MPAAIPTSFSLPLYKAKATNATDTSFASKVPTTTEPTNDGVVDLAGQGEAPTWLMLIPYGTGDADDAFDMRLLGWRKVATLWVPTILLQFTATLGTAVGVAGAAVVATEMFADTVSDPATGMGSVGANCQPSSPANNTVAHYLVDTRGCPKVEFCFDATTGNPTGMNCLWAKV